MKQIALLLLLGSFTAAAFAHPPKSVALSYDPATQLLAVAVAHPIKESPVPDPAKHFLKDIAVQVNGRPALDTAYSYQEFDSGETAMYKLDLKPGDKVSVTAACVLAGSKTSELVVKAKP